MLFSELYSAYYNAVASILQKAAKRPITDKMIHQIVEQEAFEESNLSIPSALKQKRWPLLKSDGTSILNHAPTMPLTGLEKRWLKAICSDPRIRLLDPKMPDLQDTEPLFTPEDWLVFDQYTDGDDYADPDYIHHFHMIKTAIRNNTYLQITLQTQNMLRTMTVLPKSLEYSEKDDKFRLICTDAKHRNIINLARIRNVEPCPAPRINTNAHAETEQRTVVFELQDERKAMERVLLHFAHLEKRAENIDKDRYRITLHYDPADETEILIRILSFGPMIHVIEPEPFVEQIKQRLRKQRSCEQI